MGVINIGPVWVEPFVGSNAEASATSTTVETGDTVVFNGAGSFTSDFAVTSEPVYYWTFEPLYHSNNKQPTYVFSSPGTYTVSLRVQGDGIMGLHDNFMFDWAYLTIEVTNPGSSLSGNAGGGGLGVYSAYVDEPITLQGSASGGTSPYSYDWDLGDGSTSTEQNPTHTYTTADVFTVSLTITDSTGESIVCTAIVEVSEIEELAVSITAPTSVSVETPVYFNSIISGGVGPYSYDWDFGDDSTSTEANPSHTYEFAGTYTVTLTVTDSRDNVNIATRAITVDTAGEAIDIVEVSGGFGIKAIIKAGETPVDWSISVDGFVLMGHDASGIITAGTEEVVKIPFTIAFGSVEITVTAGSLQEKYTAFALGPLFLNIQ
jgi:PKD repeat protein